MHIEHKLVMQAFEVVSSLCHYRPKMMALSEDESCRCCFKWFRDDNADVIHDFWFVLPEGLLELEGHQHTKYDSGKRAPLTHISMLFQSFLSQGFTDKVS